MKKLIIYFTLGLFSISVKATDFSVENLFNLDEIHNVRLSPDGKHFIAVVDQLERSKLVVFSLKDMKAVKVLTYQKSVKDAIQSAFWLNNDSFTFFVTRKSKTQANGFYSVGRFLASLSQEKINGASIGQVIRREVGDDNVFYDLSYRAGYAKICKNRIRQRDNRVIYKCTKSAKGKSPKVLIDSKNQLRVSYSSEDDDTRHFYYRDNDESDWQEFSISNFKKGQVSPVSLSKDDSKIMIHVSDGSSPNGFYWLDPMTKKRELIYLVNQGQYAKLGKSIDYYIYDSSYPNPKVIGYQISPEKPISIYFDETSKEAKLQRSLEAIFKDETVRIVNYSSNAEKAMVVVSSSKNPGSLYLMNIKENQLRFMFDFRPYIHPKKMLTTEPFQFKTRDGLTLVGYLTYPYKDVEKNQSLPMLVKVHGGPFGVRDRWGFDAENQLIASKGYLVLQVNFRGSGGYGNNFQYSAYRKMGAEMQDDITDATLWAVKKGYADKNRICIHGFSYGGYASLMGVVKEPDLYQCAIPSAGVYDIELMHNHGDIQRHYTGEDFLDDAWGDNETFFQERSPIFHLDKLKAALLITHGIKDERADFSQYEALTEKLDQLKYPYKHLLFKREAHSLYDRKNKKIFYDNFFKFLYQNIGD